MPKKPKGFGKFDTLMRKLVKVSPKAVQHAKGCPAKRGGSCFCKK
jgi:hypothetical protein